MEQSGLLARLRLRLLPDGGEETQGAEAEMQEVLRTVSDRLCLRAGVDALPRALESICVDAAVKLWRRRYFEGISSEGGGEVSTAFVEDIFAEYEQDITRWREHNCAKRTVQFL